MKKLSLNLDELRVESFATSPDGRTVRGTVKAFVTTDDITDPDDQWSARVSCLGTCLFDHTCGFENSCNGETCYDTCVASCLGGSCYDSCNGTCVGETCEGAC